MFDMQMAMEFIKQEMLSYMVPSGCLLISCELRFVLLEMGALSK